MQINVYMAFSVRIFRQMEQYNFLQFFQHVNETKDAAPFENSILIALREPGLQKEHGDRG